MTAPASETTETSALTCAVCSISFTPSRTGPGRPPVCCSDECRLLRRRKAAPGAHASTCRRCSANFTATKPNAIYCTRECKKAAYLHRKRETGWRKPSGTRPLEDRPCRQCAATFTVRRDNDRAFCSDDCNAAWRLERYPKAYRVTFELRHRANCTECRARFTATRSSLYCSPRCGSRSAHRAASAGKRTERHCKGCATRFAPPYGRAHAVYCTEACARRTVRRIARSSRKARIRQARIEAVDPIKVFERDDWRCHLCGGLTLKDERGSCHPDAPELDHIHPLSKGGEHSYANTACSHRSCNGRKSDTIILHDRQLAA